MAYLRSIEKSRTLRSLLGAPQRWVKGEFFANWTGEHQGHSTTKAKADCFCLVGAARKLYDRRTTGYKKLIARLAHVINAHGGSVITDNVGEMESGIISWNDKSERTYEDIIHVVQEARV